MGDAWGNRGRDALGDHGSWRVCVCVGGRAGEPRTVERTRRGEGRRQLELPQPGAGKWLFADRRLGFPCADVGTQALQPDLRDVSKVVRRAGSQGA